MAAEPVTAEPPSEFTARPTLAQAIFAAKAEIGPLPKNEKATVQTRSGGSYEYRYASLGDTKAAVDPILRKHNLLWRTFPIGTHDGPMLAYRMTLVTTGETEEGVMPTFGSETSQAHGSGITYGRRYAIWAYLDLVGDEDDDGQAASYHRESRAHPSAPEGVVDMRDRAKGFKDAEINHARAAIGLPRVPDDQAWRSVMNIPAERVDEFARALDAVRAAR